MKNSILIIIILIISTCCLLATLFTKKVVAFDRKVDDKILSYRDQFYYNYDYFVISNEGIALNDNLKLSDTLGNRRLLRDIVKSFSRPKIYLRFSQYDCSDCINAIFKVLTAYPKNSFVIITDYDDKEKFMLTRKNKGWNIEQYNLDLSQRVSSLSNEPTSLGIPLEGKGVPMLFTINGMMHTDNFFVPEKDDPDSFKRYLNAVIKKIEI